MASLSSLKQDKRDAEKKLRQYEKRLKEVKAIRGDLDRSSDDYVSDINKKIQGALREFSAGLNTGVSNMDALLSPILQSGVYDDSSLSSCRGELGREITRIEGKIEELKREIRLLKNSIADAEDE